LSLRFFSLVENAEKKVKTENREKRKFSKEEIEEAEYEEIK